MIGGVVSTSWMELEGSRTFTDVHLAETNPIPLKEKAQVMEILKMVRG